MLCLAEVVIFPCVGHVLERLSTLKWLGDEEEVVRSDRKVKGVIMALNSSVEEQLSAKSVFKGCKDPFSKNHVGPRPLDWALQSRGGYRFVVFDVVYYTVLMRHNIITVFILPFTTHSLIA